MTAEFIQNFGLKDQSCAGAMTQGVPFEIDDF